MNRDRSALSQGVLLVRSQQRRARQFEARTFFAEPSDERRDVRIARISAKQHVLRGRADLTSKDIDEPAGREFLIN